MGTNEFGGREMPVVGTATGGVTGGGAQRARPVVGRLRRGGGMVRMTDSHLFSVWGCNRYVSMPYKSCTGQFRTGHKKGKANDHD